MPYRTVYFNAPVFTQYKGVKVYHVYKYDEFSGGMRSNYFSLNADSEDNNSFDIRDLPEWKALQKYASKMNEKRFMKKVLRASITAGTLQKLWKEQHAADIF